jgi:hypothetical protein
MTTANTTSPTAQKYSRRGNTLRMTHRDLVDGQGTAVDDGEHFLPGCLARDRRGDTQTHTQKSDTQGGKRQCASVCVRQDDSNHWLSQRVSERCARRQLPAECVRAPPRTTGDDNNDDDSGGGDEDDDNDDNHDNSTRQGQDQRAHCSRQRKEQMTKQTRLGLRGGHVASHHHLHEHIVEEALGEGGQVSWRQLFQSLGEKESNRQKEMPARRPGASTHTNTDSEFLNVANTHRTGRAAGGRHTHQRKTVRGRNEDRA